VTSTGVLGDPTGASAAQGRAVLDGLVADLVAHVDAWRGGPVSPPGPRRERRLYDLAGPAEFAAQQPLGRLLDPAEVAAVSAFLAATDSGAMTGAIVAADGGLAP